jgi:hypothetical protein
MLPIYRLQAVISYYDNLIFLQIRVRLDSTCRKVFVPAFLQSYGGLVGKSHCPSRLVIVEFSLPCSQHLNFTVNPDRLSIHVLFCLLHPRGKCNDHALQTNMLPTAMHF